MLAAASALLWGPGTLVLLLGTGLYLTVRTRFLPWKNLFPALRMALGRDARQKRAGSVSPFGALMTTLAATVGTGNIVGVAAALSAGGPGALVWMELSALPGLSTRLAECTLSARFRRRDAAGRPYGGPMVVMADLLGNGGRILGALFSLFALLAAFGVGAAAQANAIADALRSAFALPPLWVGLVLALLIWFVLRGGMERVAAASSLLVPFMAAAYLAAGCAVIWRYRAALPETLFQIFRCAFAPRAALGGALGAASRWEAIRFGVARGVFSNEAGLGSAAITAAGAEGDCPARQGYISMTAVFFDTTVICTVTGLAVCCSGALHTSDPAAGGAAVVLSAFRPVLGPWSDLFLSLCVALFAFTSILGWAWQGEQAARFLLGEDCLRPYRLLFCAAAALGVRQAPGSVFLLADICNALMCLPNLLCLLLLSGTVARELEAFRFPSERPYRTGVSTPRNRAPRSP